jgi:hypothetical protein
MKNKLITGALFALVLSLAAAAGVNASSTVVVTPSDTQGWSTSDTRPGGAVNFINDATSPLPSGALQLLTDSSTTAKAQYMHEASGTLSSVTDLSYWTKQVSGPSYADASYQLLVDLDSASSTGGFTTFVYEPYQNGTVSTSSWQQWDVDAGQFWSSRSYNDGATCSVTSGGGGAPFYTLAQLQTMCPNAQVLGFGVNVGSNNPSYDVYTDGVVFNGTTYNFEVVAPDTTAPAAPTPIYPANGAVNTTATQDKVDWSDVTDASSSPVTYIYQASNSSSTNPDGSFTTPVYTSGPLTASEIPTPGTPEGTYYWHVNATDAAGNVSPWSVTWSFVVDNSTTTPPATHPTDKNQCKNNGWKTFTNPSFKNQGQCVSSVANGK